MLKNLSRAYSIAIVFFVLYPAEAVLSRPVPATIKPASSLSSKAYVPYFLRDTALFRQHSFDADGICSCLNEFKPEEPADLPRITLSSAAEKFIEDYNAENAKMLDKILLNHKSSFKTVEQIFSKRGLPVELEYLAVIESKMNPASVSYVGATGLWQLMPVTARGLGLKVNATVDERKNIYKSTVAAAKYLERLYNIYQDWLLVIAAYNCGPGGVDKAISRSGSRDFWELQNFLPKETRLHVKRFISTHYYYEGHGSLVTLTKEETINHLKNAEDYIASHENDVNNNELPFAGDAPGNNNNEHKANQKVIAVIHEDDLIKIIERR